MLYSILSGCCRVLGSWRVPASSWGNGQVIWMATCLQDCFFDSKGKTLNFVLPLQTWTNAASQSSSASTNVWTGLVLTTVPVLRAITCLTTVEVAKVTFLHWLKPPGTRKCILCLERGLQELRCSILALHSEILLGANYAILVRMSSHEYSCWGELVCCSK